MDLSLVNLEFELNGRPVIKDISAQLLAGQVTGILGPNGAGKTTLLRLAAGLLTPKTGHVAFNNPSADFNRPDSRTQHIGYLPQDNVAAWPVCVYDLVALGGLASETWADGALASVRQNQSVLKALDLCDTAHLSSRAITALSGGEQARVFLARLLATEADILLLDEPVKMLDPAHQLKTMGLLVRLAEAGRTVVVVMHDLNLALRYCDNVVLMRAGMVDAQGAPQDVFTQDRLQRIFGLDVSLVAHQGHRLVHPLRASEVGHEPDTN